MNTFNERLIEAMNRAGMKPVDLVEKSGVSKSSISQYMSGRCKAKQQALYQLAKALGVTEAWLMGYDVPAVVEPQAPAQQLAEIVNQLSDEDINILIEMARRMIK